MASLLALLINLMPVLAIPVSSPLPSGVSVASANISSLQWENCTDEFLRPVIGPRQIPPGLQCSTLEVPLDWTRPDGKRIKLALAQLPSTDQEAKIGKILMNPGGPGASAIEFILGIERNDILSPALRESFDIIGLDPRGVGLSDPPLKCNTSRELVSYSPKDQASFDRMVDDNKAFAQSCLDMSGDLLYHIDTTQAAHDHEAARIALGSEKLNYLGISYGTQLGAAYAELYPQNIRAMILDAVLDHGQTETAAIALDAMMAEQALDRFFAWCDNDPSTCAIHPQNNTAELFDEMVSKTNSNPIVVPECKDTTCISGITGEEIVRVVSHKVRGSRRPPYHIYGSSYRKLSKLLANVMAGDASQLVQNTDSYYRLDEGNQESAYVAITCLDWPRSMNFADLTYNLALSSEIAPRTGGNNGMYTTSALCIDWPAPVTNPPHPANVSGAPPILLVQSLYDAKCAYGWAEGLREQIKGSVLLTRNGDGHGSFDLMGEARMIMDAYLVNLTLPADNTVVDT